MRATVAHVSVCSQWQDQLVQLLPEDMRLRKIDATAAGASPQKVAAAEASGPSGGQAAAAAASNSQQPAPGTILAFNTLSISSFDRSVLQAKFDSMHSL